MALLLPTVVSALIFLQHMISISSLISGLIVAQSAFKYGLAGLYCSQFCQQCRCLYLRDWVLVARLKGFLFVIYLLSSNSIYRISRFA